MRTEFINADKIEEAAEEILTKLKESVRSRDNVFYLDGWGGLGASAVLRAVAQRFTTTTTSPPDGLEFEKVIHIDCSKWESKRTLQRAVAEQLDLSDEVMEMLDREDEEDDFRGVAQGSRAEVQQVVREMQQHIQNRRFLVIFHNGSSEEIDLASVCGFPLSGYSTSKVLWTFQGRFRVKPWAKVDTAMKSEGTTDIFLLNFSVMKKQEELWSYLVLQEAADVVSACHVVNTVSSNIIHQSEGVADCFRYMSEVGLRGRHLTDYDLVTHCANYWMCDGIIQHRQEHDEDIIGLWRAAEALHREMRLDMDYHQYVPSSQMLSSWQIQTKPYWTSPTYGFILIPTRAKINGNMFQHYADKLCVLKLSGCTLDFQSPPFLCCHSLRFLWLDNCHGTRTSTDVAGKEEDICLFLQKLWVLDVRNTDCDQILCAQMLALMTQLRELNVMGVSGWDMGQLQGKLPNIFKLRVKYSTVGCSCSFSGMNKMEHFDFSGNFLTGGSIPMMSSFGPRVSSNVSCLETVSIVDGCYGAQEISFSGYTELKNLQLGGPMSDLHILDISGTAVKILDLSTTSIEHLDELYLLDCKKLCAILWPPKDKMKQELDKLCVDTTQSAYTAQSREEKATRGTSTATIGTSVQPVAAPHGSRTSSEFDWYISLRNARFLVSLEQVYSVSRKAYVEVSSPGHSTAVVGKSNSEQQVLVNRQQQPVPAIYANITVDHQHEASDTPGIMWMWPCPNVPDLAGKTCYLRIQDQMGTQLLSGGEETSAIAVPKFVIDGAAILHVHDSLSMTIFPSCTTKYLGSEWPMLEWCRIERCPKLDCVFTSREPGGPSFSYRLTTFWGSHLLEARYIWKTSETSYSFRVFPHLTFLHLVCCPRLIHVLPLSYVTFKSDPFAMEFGRSMSRLETLEITWCGDLREVFPLDTRAREYVEHDPHPVTLHLPSLKHIHLHELPRLERICEVRMSAPNLETVKIRGCWSLTCLPDVSGTNKIVECDCEKEWWDRLEWDDRSQVEHYKPIHSQYYKKNILRTTVLR